MKKIINFVVVILFSSLILAEESLNFKLSKDNLDQIRIEFSINEVQFDTKEGFTK